MHIPDAAYSLSVISPAISLYNVTVTGAEGRDKGDKQVGNQLVFCCENFDGKSNLLLKVSQY